MKKTGRNKGHTLAAVIVFLLLVTLLWRGSLSQQGSYFRVEKACKIHQANRDGCMHSLAWALTLLETGLPPKSRYSCLMVSPVDANEIFVATFNRHSGMNYTVSIRLAARGDESLPVAPETFEQVEPTPGPRPRPGRPERPGRPGGRQGSDRTGRGRSNKNGQQKDTKQSKEPRGAKESGQSGQKERSQKGKK